MTKINFVGDIALFKQFEERDIDPILELELPGSDYNVGNFEFIIPQQAKKNFYDVEDSLRCSYKFLDKIKLEKFNLLGLANNHCMDYGKEGVRECTAAIRNKGIDVFGFSQDNSYNIGFANLNGISFCFIGVVKEGRWSKQNYQYGPDEYDVPKITHLIKLHKEKIDHIIIFPHWGTELVDIPDPADVINARKFIEQGASAVIGHHPHVPQGVEKYKNGLIAYSLGSFVYVPAAEPSYKEGLLQIDISICLNVEFNKKKITAFTPVYYRNNVSDMVPKPIVDQTWTEYIGYLNSNIDNTRLYYRNIRKILLKREYRFFIRRLKKNPVKTIFGYLKYIKLAHIRKICKI